MIIALVIGLIAFGIFMLYVSVKWACRVIICLKEMGCLPAFFIFLIIGIAAILGIVSLFFGLGIILLMLLYPLII